MSQTQLYAFLSSFLNNDSIIEGNSSAATPYLLERRGNFTSKCDYIVFPRSTSEATKIVHYCYEHGINIVPQSGNTGLAGGSVAQENQIIISTKNLNSILEIDKKNYSMTVQSGVILKQIQETALQHQLFFPLSLPSENTCTIGGNLATCAGGINAIRYGNMRDLALGIEVVLPNGTLYSDLNKLRKRNIGSDFKHLFIGSEGTLGFITAATIKLFPQPKYTINLLCGFKSLHEIENYFTPLYNTYGNNITSFELFNYNSLLLVEKIGILSCPISNSYPYYLIASLDFFDDNIMYIQYIKDDLNSLLSKQKHEFVVTEENTVWDIRYNIPKAQVIFGDSLKHDISTPLSHIETFIEKMLYILEKKYPNLLLPIVFGHLGDGNLHFNISKNFNTNIMLKDYKEKIKALVVEEVTKIGGTFSAEHGIGLIHKNELKQLYADNQYSLLTLIKNTFDNKNIFNPNKII